MSNQQKSKKLLVVGLNAWISGSHLCFILLQKQLGIGNLEALGNLSSAYNVRVAGMGQHGVTRYRHWKNIDSGGFNGMSLVLLAFDIEI